MEMRHDLSPLLAAAYYQPIAFLRNPFFFRQPVGHFYHIAGERCLVISQLGQGRNMLLWYDQYMSRRCRIDITEGNYLFVLIPDFTRHFSRYNLAEDAVHSLITLSSELGPALLKDVLSINVIGYNRRKVVYA